LHPNLGRAITNLILLLVILDASSLLLLKPGEAEFYVAIIGLSILLVFFAVVVYDIRREAAAKPIEKKVKGQKTSRWHEKTQVLHTLRRKRKMARAPMENVSGKPKDQGQQSTNLASHKIKYALQPFKHSPPPFIHHSFF